MTTNGIVKIFKILDIRCGDVSKEITSYNASDSFNVDAISRSDMVDTIFKSLNQPKNQKSIDSVLLYDEVGLQLFDEITRLDEYYLTNAERNILQHHADELANRVKDGANIVELGSGSLTKTQLILTAMERNKKHVTYYALDLNQRELENSLSSLGGQFNYVQLKGLLGTYEQAISWLKLQCTNNDTATMIVWLGSSIGSHTRRDSAIFLRRFVRSCLKPGDLFVIGFDRRKDASTVLKAYNDEHGVVRKFILNCLDHLNNILGEQFFNRDDFEYHSTYQENYGRHVCHLRANRDVNLEYHKKRSSDADIVAIRIEQGELIHLAFSHKYSMSEIANILDASELDLVEMWSDSKLLYRLVLSEYNPLLSKFGGDDDIIDVFFPYDHGAFKINNQDKHLECLMCST